MHFGAFTRAKAETDQVPGNDDAYGKQHHAEGYSIEDPFQSSLKHIHIGQFKFHVQTFACCLA